MTRMSGASNRGFTLVELLVVVAMIAIIASAFTVSMASAMQRARIQKATGEVKSLTQAFLAYENYMGEGNALEETEDKEVTTGNFPYLFGKSTSSDGSKIPVLIQASLTQGGIMRDPWGHAYKVTIRKGTIPRLSLGTVQTGYYLPNFNRLTKEERNLQSRKEAGK